MTLDFILLLVLCCMTVSGYRRGILGALCSLLVIVISFFGAFIAMGALNSRAAAMVEPKIQLFLEQRLTSNIFDRTQTYIDSAEATSITIGGESYSLGDLVDFLDSAGFDVEENIQNSVASSSEGIVSYYAAEIAAQLAAPIGAILTFIAAFLILYLILHTLEMILEGNHSMSVLTMLNKLSGAILGLASGVILLTALVIVAKRNGIINSEQAGGPLLTLLQRLTDVLS